MRLQRGSRTATIAVLVMFGAATTTVAHAQSTDELKQRIEELERSTREQVDALKRMLQQQEAERAKERRAQEERERTLRTLQEQVEQQQLSLQKQKEDVSQALAGLSNFFDLKAGARQTNNGPPPFFGEDIPGNVYSAKDFKIRLGGSLRLHVQHNDTPVGESVSSALLPAAAPGGGNNASREAFRAFVSRTRLNLALQGPETLGAKTSAYFEMDFNQTASGSGEVKAANNNPRLRWAIGLEAGRRGGDFGIGATRIYARATWGEFRERFNQGTLTENLPAQTNFTQHTFDNQTAAFSVTLDRIGFNQTGQALTLRLKGGGVWARGEGRISNSEFDRRVILDGGGHLVPAQSLGGWINPQFYLTDTLSLRWAGGEQFAVNSNMRARAGALLADPAGATLPKFFRVNNFQSEVSL